MAMANVNINEKVIITAIGFRKNLMTYPRRMEFRGDTYRFIDAGLRCLIRHGERIIEIITLSDGTSNYHLRKDSHESNWTLISIGS